MGFSELFIDVETLPDDAYGFVQLLFLGLVYGYLIMSASIMISTGAELLLLVPSVAGIVGSIVVPFLSSVPDGCLVLFSGIGPSAQEQLSIGVGALTGSTIMVLTVPWFIAIVNGRVNIDPRTNKALYSTPKLTPPDLFDLFKTGIAVSPQVNAGAYVIAFTALTYLFLQVPGLVYLHETEEQQAEGERMWALVGIFVCLVMFIGYLYQQYSVMGNPDTAQAQLRERILVQAIQNKQISLLGMMVTELQRYESLNQEAFGTESTPLSSSFKSTKTMPELIFKRLHRLLKPFFQIYDVDNSGSLEINELHALFHDLGERLSAAELIDAFSEFDQDKSGKVDYKEFVTGTASYISKRKHLMDEGYRKQSHAHIKELQVPESTNEEDDDEEEEEENEEIPEELKQHSPDEQQRRIKNQATWLMAVGTIVVILFSDPLVEVLKDIGRRTGIPPFYVAFTLAPFTGNAAELITAYKLSMRKTHTTVSVSLATLQGSAIMNNTFVLGIFMVLVYTQGLVWQFFAETLTVLVAQILLALIALKKTHTVFDGFLVLSIFPLSLVLVTILEYCGWD